MELDYSFLKMAHIIGAVMMLGNIMVTAVWKSMADRTKNPQIIAFAQRLVTLTDFAFTLPGAVMLLAAGDYIAYVLMDDSWSIGWIFWGRILFIISGLLWVLVLVPVQIKQAKLASAFADGSPIPEQYWKLNRIWMSVGSMAVLLPLIVVAIMVLKPA
jgi:uncharacterized membrane protein